MEGKRAQEGVLGSTFLQAANNRGNLSSRCKCPLNENQRQTVVPPIQYRPNYSGVPGGNRWVGAFDAGPRYLHYKQHIPAYKYNSDIYVPFFYILTPSILCTLHLSTAS